MREKKKNGKSSRKSKFFLLLKFPKVFFSTFHTITSQPDAVARERREITKRIFHETIYESARAQGALLSCGRIYILWIDYQDLAFFTLLSTHLPIPYLPRKDPGAQEEGPLHATLEFSSTLFPSFRVLCRILPRLENLCASWPFLVNFTACWR